LVGQTLEQYMGVRALSPSNAPNSTGYAAVGDKAGTYVGTQLTVDTPVYAKASATLTNIVYVHIQYYMPQQGMTW
jgi:hypothetical protein